MSEIQHPPINMCLSIEQSPERVFAEEAFQMLEAFAVPNFTRVGDIYTTYPVTERYDIITDDDEPNGYEQALRLRALPVFTSPDPEGDLESSDQFYVIELQQGILQEQIDPAADEDYAWTSYLMVVIDRHYPNDVCVLDAKTGKDLEPEDLARGLYVLQIMRQELRATKFEEGMISPEVAPEYTKLERGYLPFDSSDHLSLSSCDNCQTENMPCGHNPETLN